MPAVRLGAPVRRRACAAAITSHPHATLAMLHVPPPCCMCKGRDTCPRAQNCGETHTRPAALSFVTTPPRRATKCTKWTLATEATSTASTAGPQSPWTLPQRCQHHARVHAAAGCGGAEIKRDALPAEGAIRPCTVPCAPSHPGHSWHAMRLERVGSAEPVLGHTHTCGPNSLAPAKPATAPKPTRSTPRSARWRVKSTAQQAVRRTAHVVRTAGASRPRRASARTHSRLWPRTPNGTHTCCNKQHASGQGLAASKRGKVTPPATRHHAVVCCECAWSQRRPTQ